MCKFYILMFFSFVFMSKYIFLYKFYDKNNRIETIGFVKSSNVEDALYNVLFTEFDEKNFSRLELLCNNNVVAEYLSPFAYELLKKKGYTGSNIVFYDCHC